MSKALAEAWKRDLAYTLDRAHEMDPPVSKVVADTRELFAKLSTALVVIKMDTDSSAEELRQFAADVLEATRLKFQ